MFHLTITELAFSFGLVAGLMSDPSISEYETAEEARAALDAFAGENNAGTYQRGTYTYSNGAKEEYGDIFLLNPETTQFTSTRWTYIIDVER
jgi:hypothetical protein